MNNEPVVWMSEVEGGTMYTNYEYPESVPLYTHQYERPHNTVLVPCDKLAEMQAEIKDLKQQVAFLEDWRDTWRPFLKAITGKVNDERK